MRRALHLPSRRYEFEIDVLILAKHLRISTCEVPIETIYIEGNRSSHFNPLFDSMRIWFVLLRFGFVSLLTALIDNLVFFLSFRLTGQIASSQAAARLVAMSFNYLTVRRTVFLSRDTHLRAFPRYAALVAVNGLISYALIRLFADLAGVPVMAAKITAETLLFLMNFVIQRDFIFTGSFLDAGAESDR
jgi:putative flippase GtrA